MDRKPYEKELLIYNNRTVYQVYNIDLDKQTWYLRRRVKTNPDQWGFGEKMEGWSILKNFEPLIHTDDVDNWV